MTTTKFFELNLGSRIADGQIKISATKFYELLNQARVIEKEQIIETGRYYFHERGKLTPGQYYDEIKE